jgi:uncharacterized coiled-coil DUF342 family protein
MPPKQKNLQKLKQTIRLAERAAGIQRETLLLLAANELFDHQVISENEWRNITSQESDSWLRQMHRLLNSLEYSVAFAEAYSGEIPELSAEANKIQEKLNGIQEKRAELKGEILELRQMLEATERKREELEGELSTLKDLKELIPIREELEAIFGKQIAHSKANQAILQGVRDENKTISDIQKKIDALLSEQDRLLKKSILETERDWQKIRKRIRR